MALDITTLASTDLLSDSRGDINTNFTNIKTDLDALSDDLENLTDGEVTQLEAIGATTISAAQWAYLGDLDQALKTTSNVSFGTVDCGAITSSGRAEINSRIRTTSADNAPTSGVGLEMFYNGTEGVIYAYDRDTPGYKDIEFSGGNITIAGTLGCGAITSTGALTATSYDGVLAANLLDKSATEEITGAWTFPSNVQFAAVSGTHLDLTTSATNSDCYIKGEGQLAGVSKTWYIGYDYSGSDFVIGQGSSLADCQIHINSTGEILLKPAGTLALTLDSSQNATFAGTLACGAITSTGDIQGTGLTVTSGDVIINTSLKGMITDTADGSDNAGLTMLAAGYSGGLNHTRGGGIACYGNEYTTIGGNVDIQAGNSAGTGAVRIKTGAGTEAVVVDKTQIMSTKNHYPLADNTYYLGKNDDDTPFAWKGVILKDTTDGKYYRIEVISGTVTATDLTD